MSNAYEHDVLVIGSGAAGLTAALKLADHCRVAVACKGELLGGSTYWAQGGIAGVISTTDSYESHINDTLEAGAGLCNEDAVRFTVEKSTESIQWLINLNVPFTEYDDLPEPKAPFHLTKEGGHSHRRILHAADATGRAIFVTLMEQAKAHENIEFFENRVAVDLLSREKMNLPGNGCFGAYVLNQISGEVEVFRSRFVVLATGGASKVYLYTSNPDSATGDGIAMAWRAGCRVANLEFNQFHPTCLYHPEAKSFLISEALRGEGAHLKLPDGERFMHKFDERGELASRDVVARAIDYEMKRIGSDSVFLDISHKPPHFVMEHFPTIYERCLRYGIDITREPIPVVPAAHYTCGGIFTHLNGHTDLKNLYAIGESACTGFHGANRLASNSLLECIVMGQAASEGIINKLADSADPDPAPAWDESQVTDSDEDVVISHNWDELRRFMWDYVGIVRTDKRLERAEHRIDLLKKEIQEYYKNYKVGNDLLELRNLVVVADLIIQSARLRKESRGLHYTLDYPNTNNHQVAAPTILTPSNWAARAYL